MWLENAMRKRSGNPFRTFVHPVWRMEQIIRQARQADSGITHSARSSRTPIVPGSLRYAGEDRSAAR